MSDGRTGVELQKVVEIDGEMYKILMLSPSKAFVMAVDLGKIIGAPVGAMATSAGDAKKAAEAVPIAIQSLMQNLESKKLLELCKTLCASIENNGKLIDAAAFELHFHGRLDTMMKLVTKAVEVQFGTFFTAIVGSITDLIAKAGE